MALRRTLGLKSRPASGPRLVLTLGRKFVLKLGLKLVLKLVPTLVVTLGLTLVLTPGLAIAAPAAAATAGACDTLPEVPLEPVAAGVWRVPAARGESDPANGGRVTQLVVVRDGRRVWLIGSGPTPAYGAALACSVQRMLGRPVSEVVDTRAAPELSMGNIAFGGAGLHALPDVIATMQERCSACLERLRSRIGPAGESLRLDRIRVPTLPVGRPGAAAGRLGPFDWRALERSAGERTLVLRDRRSGVVVAQGLVWEGDIPDLRDTDSARLLASLRELQRFAAGATSVVGEQGEPARPDAIAQQIAYLEALRDAATLHLKRGDVDGASGSGIELPAFAAWPGYASRHPLNLQRVWRELEPEIFR